MVQLSERSFAVIVSLDLVGYSRLTERDEIGTHRALMACFQERLVPIVRDHQGEVIKPTGDGAAHALLAAVYRRGQQNRWQIGQGLTRINMLNRARLHLSRVTSPSPISHMVRSETLTASGRHERAIVEARRALQMDATRSVGHYAEGRALLFAG